MITHSDLEISELKDEITLLWYQIRKSELLENKADADEKSQHGVMNGVIFAFQV